MKKMKKIILIVTLLFLTVITPFKASDNGTNNPTPTPTSEPMPTPTLTPDFPQITPTPPPMGTGIPRLISPHNITLEAGNTYEATIVIRNVGTREINNLFTIAVPDTPFTVEFLRNTNRVAMLGTDAQRNMTLRITVSENAEAGNYNIELNHFFSTPENETNTSSDRITITIEEDDDDDGTPEVRLGNFSMNPSGTLAPEQSFSVSAEISNIGDAIARDIRVALPENMRASDEVFITSDLNLANVHTLDIGGRGIIDSFVFQTSPDIKTGAYTILFSVSYRGEDSTERITEVFPFTVNVYAPDEDDEPVPTLELRTIIAPTGRIEVNHNGVISFQLHNTSDIEARNIRVEAIPENEQAIVPMTANTQTLRSLMPGESQLMSFTFSPRESAVTRSYAIRFRISYEPPERGSEAESFEQFVAFNVYNPDEDEDEDTAKQIPRVMVSEYSLDPAVPRAGQEFEMTVTFRNTSSTRSVNNIRVLMEEITTTTASQQGQQQHFAGFAPVSGSNTLFIDSLEPLSDTTMVLRFTTSGEATSGAHTMRISFDYQDQDFVTHEANQQISISVAQVTRLELTEVDVPPTGMVGMPVRFSLRVINSGRVNLSNLRIRTVGQFNVAHAGGEAGEFIGPLNLQRTLDFHGQFVPEEPGTHDGEFIVFGEDPTGAMHEVRFPFTIEVEGGFDFGDDFMGGDFPDAWGGDRGMSIDRGGDFMWEGGGMDFGMEQEQPGLFTRLFKRTVYVAPEWWNEEFDGAFSPEVAQMQGIQPVEQWNYVVIVSVVGGAIAVIAVIVIIVKHRKKKSEQDDED